jgi:predicted HAD superfamily hydrolase
MQRPVHSFDVFDTVVTRRVGSPIGAFLWLGRRLKEAGLCSYAPRTFAELRIQAERRAQQSVHKGGPTLEEIYRELLRDLGWNQAKAEQAMRLELKVETELLTPVPVMKELVEKSRAYRARIVYVSDMYWSSDQIRVVLNMHRLCSASDEIFVSSEAKCGKTGGALFRRMMQRTITDPKCIRHVGNNYGADITGAQRAGIKAQYFESGNLSRRESILLEDGYSAWDQATSGTARLIRLQTEASVYDSHRRTLANVVAGVAMPTLLNFAQWVVRRAVAKRIRRLIFVSRDGWLLQHCVRYALSAANQSIECKFIYGSRQAWHGAAIDPETLAENTWLFDGACDLTASKIIARLNLSKQTSYELVRTINEHLGGNQILSEKDKAKTLEIIAQHPRTTSELRENRSSVLAYLRQEGLDSSEPTALVDLGWVGRLQTSFNALLEHMGTPPVIGLYFGLEKSKDQNNHSVREAFLFDRRSESPRVYVPGGTIQILESFCTQRHGSTIGYRRGESGRWEPTFRLSADEELINWGIDHVHEVSLAYLQELQKIHVPINESEAELVQKTTKILYAFIEHPEPEEARAWGAFPFEHEQAGGGVVPLATAYPSLLRGVKSILRGRSTSNTGGYWKAAARRLTPGTTRFILELFAQASRQLRHQRRRGP